MGSVTLLNTTSDQQMSVADEIGNAARTELFFGPFPTDALILATASGHADYSGPQAGAGITLIIKVDGNQVSEADSFEAQSSEIRFRASTSFNFVLKQNTRASVEARIDPMGSGGASNKFTRVSLQCFVLATNS
jgi:hypothetical protein